MYAVTSDKTKQLMAVSHTLTIHQTIHWCTSQCAKCVNKVFSRYKS